jgi:ABC-2 type transport system permease protein
MRAFAALVRKDLILWFSNRRNVVVGLAAPVLIAAFFGYLFDPHHDAPSRIPVAVTDADSSELSAAIVTALSADSALEVRPMPEAEGADAVRRGDVRAAIVLPAGLGEAALGAMFGGARRPQITLRHDPSQSMSLAVVRGVLAQHVMAALGESLFGAASQGRWIDTARRDLDQARGLDGARRKELQDLLERLADWQQRQPRGGDVNARFQLPYDTLEIAATANAASGYNSYAHSFAGMGVQFVLFSGIDFGIGVLLARRLGIWQRLRAAPVSPRVLLASRIASAGIIALFLLLAIFLAGMLLFGVRVEGSVTAFLGVCAAFAFLTGAFGLLIAALGRTPEATRSLAIVVTLFLVMLGGAWVPSFVFPPWLQTVSLVVPTRWAVDGLDAAIWRGQDLPSVLPAIGVLFAFALAFALIAWWRFDWDDR